MRAIWLRTRVARLPKALKITLASLGALLGLAVLLVGALLVAGNTAGGRILIERLVAHLSSGRVRIAGLEGSFPASIELGSLQLGDARGVWLEAAQVSLHWSPLALLTRHVEIDRLECARLTIARRPQSEDTHPAGKWPEVDVGGLTIATLTLGPELVGAPTTLARGRAHLRSLEEASASLHARRQNGDGSYDLDFALTPTRIDGTLALAEPASGPLENLLGLPGLGALSLTANVRGPRTAERLDLAVAAGALHGHAAGEVNLLARSATLNYHFDAPAMAPSPVLAWRALSVQGTWSGPLSGPTASGQLRIEALQFPGELRIATLSASLQANGGAVRAQGVLNGLVLPGPRPGLLADAPLELDASVRFDSPDRPLELTAAHRLFTLHAQVNTARERGAFDLRLPELAPFAALSGLTLHGHATARGELRRERDGIHIELDSTGQIGEGPDLWAHALAGAVRLELTATASDRELDLDRLRLTGRALVLSLSGHDTFAGPAGGTGTPRRADDLHGRFDLAVARLAVLSPTLAGTLKVSGHVDGPRTALATEATLSATLAVRGSPTGTVTASLRARGLPSAPYGTLQAQGRLAGAPVLLEAALERVGTDTAHVLIRRADWRSAHLQGDLTSGTDGAHARGHIRLELDRLQDLEPLLGTTLGGSVEGNLSLAAERGQSTAQLAIDARDLSAGRWHGDLHLTGSGPTHRLQLGLEARVPAAAGAAETSLTSQAILDLDTRALTLTGAELRDHGVDARLLAPARVSWDHGLTVERLRLGAEQAVLELDGRLLPELDARASLRGARVALLNAAAPGLFSAGTVQADAALHGTLSSPSGTVEVDAQGLRLKTTVALGVPALDAHASATLRDGVAQLDGRLTAGRSSQIHLQGRAPLNAAGAVLDLKIGGQLDLTLVNPVLEAHGRHAAGLVAADATVTGPLSAPDIKGSVSLRQGEYRDYALGVHLSDVRAELEGSQASLRLTSFAARAAPGTVSMTGNVGILQPGVPVDLKLTARDARPIASNILTAEVNANLKLSGKLREQLELSGVINALQTQIEIPDSLPPDVAVLDVRRPGQTAAPPVRKLVIALDLKLDAENQVLVRGRGLSAELGGEVRIKGTTDEPIVSGGFDLIRGTFSLASSQLTFSNGRVSFNGEGLKKRIDPTLDFTAQTSVLDVTATLKITGLADAPQFTLTSTPELPQDEVLARLLFGEAAAQLSTLQLAEVGVALTSLTGSGGLNPLARIQKSLGLDRLAVGGGTSPSTGQSTNTGATIAAGRYVSKRVYVGAKQSTTGASQLQVEVDLTKHLKLQSQLGNGTAPVQGTTPENDPGSSVGLSYQFEY